MRRCGSCSQGESRKRGVNPPLVQRQVATFERDGQTRILLQAPKYPHELLPVLIRQCLNPHREEECRRLDILPRPAPEEEKLRDLSAKVGEKVIWSLKC